MGEQLLECAGDGMPATEMESLGRGRVDLREEGEFSSVHEGETLVDHLMSCCAVARTGDQIWSLEKVSLWCCAGRWDVVDI